MLSGNLTKFAKLASKQKSENDVGSIRRRMAPRRLIDEQEG